MSVFRTPLSTPMKLTLLSVTTLLLLLGVLMLIPAPPSSSPTTGTSAQTPATSQSMAASLWSKLQQSTTPASQDPTLLGPGEQPDLALSNAVKEQEAFMDWASRQGSPEAQAQSAADAKPQPYGFLDSLKAKVGMASPRLRDSDPPALPTPRPQAGGAAILLGPNGACVDNFGMIYVADTGHSRIQAFYPDGVTGASWGSAGSKPGEFKTPVDLACGPDGTVYAADMENHRIQAFKPNGELQTDWGSKGVVVIDKSLPFGLAVDGLGLLYIADVSTRSVRIIDGAGLQINQLTDPHIKTMTDLYVGTDNTLYIADQEAKAIHVFIEDIYQKSFPLPQSPRALTADRDGQLFVALTDGTILSMTTRGSIIQTWRPNDQQPWYGPTGLASWKNRLYIVSQSLATVWAFTP